MGFSKYFIEAASLLSYGVDFPTLWHDAVAVLRDPAITSGIGQFGAIQSVAPSLGLEASPLNVSDAGEIERDIVAFARSPNGGLIVTSSPKALLHRDLIIALAARHRLPPAPQVARRPPHRL